MKTPKRKFNLRVLVLLGLLLQTMVYAQATELQPENVTILNGVITACTYDFESGSTDIIIPDNIGGETIIGIGAAVFKNQGITSVVLPSMLQTIGFEAFRNTKLTAVDFEQIAGPLEIGEASFRQSTLTTLTITANISSIGTNAFRDNTSLATVLFSDENPNLKAIGASSFRGTTSLNSITIPAYIETIGSDAFYLSALNTLTFEAGSQLKTLSRGAFDGRNGNALESISIPASVETIDEFAFRENALTSVVFDSGSKLRFINANAFVGNTELSEIVLPASISEGQELVHWLVSDGGIVEGNMPVSDYAVSYTAVFADIPDCPDCYTLTEADVTVVDGVITACTYDFESGSTDIIIPDVIGGETIIGIGAAVFKNKGITSVALPSTLQTIGFEAFRNTKLAAVDFEQVAGPLEIGEASFRQSTLTNLTITANISSIGTNAFRDNASLAAVLFSDENPNLKAIGASSFRGTTSLNSITIPAYIETIGSDAFYLSALNTLTFEAGSQLKTLSRGAFDGRNGNTLETISIPASVETIGEFAFRENALTSVVFDSGSKLRFINANAFVGNTELSEIVLPESISEGQEFVHWLVSDGGIVEGIMPVSDYEVSYTVVFADIPDCPDCYTLTEADVTVVDGVIISCSYDFENGNTNIMIPLKINGETIIGIGESVFKEKGLTYVALPATLTTIKKEAFRKCPLTSIELSHLLGELVIGEAAFRDSSFDTLTIGKNVKSIGLNAFRNNQMKHLVFTENSIIDSIAESAFRFNELTDLTIPASVRYIGKLAFNTNDLVSLNFEENSQLVIINDEAFDGFLREDYEQSNKLTELIIPKSVEVIKRRAFRDNALGMVAFEEGSMLKTIDPEAFIGNSPDLAIELPALEGSEYGFWLASDGTNYEGGAEITDFTLGYEAVPDNLEELVIYVSQSTGSDDNDGLSIESPIRSLFKAKELFVAAQQNENYGGYQLLLKGGDLFDDLTSMTSDELVSDDALRSQYAFVWDINKPLLLSTYGSDEKAMIYSGKYTYEGGPQGAIAVCHPSNMPVIIENIHIKRFQANAFLALSTSNVIFRHNKVEEIGTYYFPGETEPGIFCAGVFYVRNSSNVKALHNEFIDMHNAWIQDGTTSEHNIDGLHAFYLTRLTGGEIAYNTVTNTSGPPLKFRRALTNNIHVHNNEFYYSVPSIQMALLKGFAQTGWVRYSGDPDGGCPFAIVIENNIFHYPYCWDDKENCETAVAEKYSISNTTVCGADAVEDPDNVLWLNNDFIYGTHVSVDEGIRLTNDLNCYADIYSRELTIKCLLQQPGNANIQIFDIFGRMTAQVYEGYLSEGEQVFTWRGEKTGLYLIRMIVNGEVSIKKVIL